MKEAHSYAFEWQMRQYNTDIERVKEKYDCLLNDKDCLQELKIKLEAKEN